MAKSIRFKLGMTVMINSNDTGLGGKTWPQGLDQFDYKKGEHVELLKYDSEDETWNVKAKHKVSIWIKRKNLAPIEVKAEPTANPFKVGDKVELIDKDAQWASNDNVTTGVEYTVKQVHDPATGQKVPYIKVSGDKASGIFWIECKYFKKAEPKAKAVDLTDTRGWKEGDILSKDILNDGTYRDFYGFTSYGKKWVSMECKGFYGSDARTIEKIKVIKGRLAAKISECSANIWIAIDTLPVKEEPKPVETPKKEVVKMKCVDADGWRGYLTLGKTYEVELDPKDSGSVRVINPDNPYGSSGDGSLRLFKNRFELVETPKKRMAVCVNMDGSFETSYMVGKVYEIYKETSDYYYLAEVDGKRYEGGMFKYRFKEIVDQSTPVGPRVGDTLSEKWLKDGTPRFYWGFTTGGGWLKQTVTYFNGDRKIEGIKMVDGRMAALISGTCNIWIDLEELTGEKSTVDKTFTVTVSKDKLAAFNKEVQALIAKYK